MTWVYRLRQVRRKTRNISFSGGLDKYFDIDKFVDDITFYPH